MKWAIAQGYRSDNPPERLSWPRRRRWMRRLRTTAPCLTRKSARPLARIGRSDGKTAARLALVSIVLCAVRSGEARDGRWDEIDLETATWTIPAKRMKSGREHRVPLSDRFLAVLDEAAAIRDGDVVFPSPRRGKPLFRATLSRLLRDCRVDAVPHGFRSSFRDWATEQTETPHAVMEATLAHTVRNAVEAPTLAPTCWNACCA